MSAAPRKGGSSSAAARPPATNTPQATEKSDIQIEDEKSINRIRHWEVTLTCANKRYDELIAFDRAMGKSDISRIVGSHTGLVAAQRVHQLGDGDDRPLDPVQVMPVDGHNMQELERKHRFRIITVMYGNEERDASLLLPPRQTAAARGAGSSK
jgi:hypothetical protein